MRPGRCLSLVGAALAAWSLPASAQGQFPNQPVRIVVPFGPGSQTDLLARSFADKLAGIWKQQVIVENKPGLAGTASVAKGPTDGHTVMLTGNGHTIIGALNKNTSFDPVKDFIPVTKIASVPGVLVAPENGVKTLKELIDKARAEPGTLNYASAGLGSVSSTGIELLKSMAKIDLVHVPFKGLAGSHTATIRGDTALTLTFYSAAGDLIGAGKLRPLAVTVGKRIAVLPNVPTVAEAGVPGFEYDPWFGLFVPAGVPAPIVEQIAKDFGAAGNAPDLRERFSKLGALIDTTTPAAFAALVKSDGERFSKLFTGAAK